MPAADGPSVTGMESPKVVDNQDLKFDTALKLDAGRVGAAPAPR